MSIRENILVYSDLNHQFTLKEINERLSPQFSVELSTIRWHINQLVKKGLLAHVSQGVYSRYSKNEYMIEVSDRLRDVYRVLRELFPFAPFCIYEGHVFERLQQHLSYNNLIYVETDKFITDEVFENLIGKGYSVYLKPDKDFMYKYVDIKKEAIIVRNLVSQAPLKKKEVPLPTLEKLLVDIPKEPDLFYLQEDEYQSILENALQNYSVDQTKLLRYAGRRGYRSEMEERIKRATQR